MLIAFPIWLCRLAGKETVTLTIQLLVRSPPGRLLCRRCLRKLSGWTVVPTNAEEQTNKPVKLWMGGVSQDESGLYKVHGNKDQESYYFSLGRSPARLSAVLIL